ncbi:replication initiation factor domain-containing protein [Morganella sp. EGD-HP17]|uniref:replication initiation factor domain-containing protein n=1 Tax=Morganella sp. EGD-HP17 TaxID=1435146 RepID=UPI0003F59FBA|nr:replication initiation factor domain-containing protein [Morganella sp. EGD-HP17]ETO41239.1 hypothetical protein X965_11215 [Morganella sp. EGD-HP17]
MHTYSKRGFEWRKYPPLPDIRNFKSAYFSSETTDLTPEETTAYISATYNCYFERMKIFMSEFFGLAVGPSRGRGGHFYQDSAPLFSVDGGYELLGTVYFGGNCDTVYIQISGKGCAHVFSYTTPESVHNILEHLGITTLKRLDLATDDYHGIYTCQAAVLAYKDDAFYGGMGPRPCFEYSQGVSADGEITKEMLTVGSRKSRVYWRIYNKAAEQKVTGVWFRSEAELKDVPLDVLTEIAATYTGICAYSAQINTAPPQKITRGAGRRAIDSVEGMLRWIRKQGSSTLAKIFHLVEGDPVKLIELVIQEKHIQDLNIKFDIAPLYQNLIRQKLQTGITPF